MIFLSKVNSVRGKGPDRLIRTIQLRLFYIFIKVSYEYLTISFLIRTLTLPFKMKKKKSIAPIFKRSLTMGITGFFGPNKIELKKKKTVLLSL